MANPKSPRPASAPRPYGDPMPPDQAVQGVSAASTKPPAPVKVGMALLLVSGALNVISAIITLANKSAIRTEAVKQYPAYTSTHIDQLVNSVVVTAIILDVVVAAIYVTMVIFMRKGRSWARIVTWVIVGLFTLLALLDLRQLGSGVSVAFALVSLAINIGIIISLWQKPANQFFAPRPKPMF